MKPVQQPVTFPHPVLPSADWANCYAVPITDSNLTAIEVASNLFNHPPSWMKSLMGLRNRFVAMFGLKAVTMEMGGDTGFPVISTDANRVVMGFDDKHLDFRIVLDVLPARSGQTVSVTTLVDRKTLAGHMYIFFVGPVHKVIVPIHLKTLN